ncbi:MAG: MBL fold metallo-hydrolase [Bacteroidia bacterium]|nr:MBL fold metallo-hydrolase [Bacteroidia bacterium]
MKVEQIYTGCLAQGAYYIQSEGEAAIIDPLRETGPYLERARKDNVQIKYIFETHFHADFVSGHLDLSKATGAPIVYGPQAAPAFDAHIAADGETFRVGKVTLKVLHTPGHTLESSCFLLLDENGEPHSLFTGDTLFLGDVGRPDLAQKAANLTQDELAGMLYDSIYTKILPLPDSLVIYPGHGAGSACGKNMMKETVDTLGHQKTFNYALMQPTREAFIEAVTDGLSEPPAYFPQNVLMNKEGYDSLAEVKERALQALDPAAFKTVAGASEALVLDTRNADAFAAGHIPGSISIGVDGQFAPWVGALIGDVNQAILLVADAGREEEVITRLSRVGFDNVLGYLAGGFDAWKQAGMETDSVNRISAAQFAEELPKHPDYTVLDVRKPSEFALGHYSKAASFPLDDINTWFGTQPKEHMYIHCAGGYRSMIAASILKARGIHDFKEVAGGWGAISKTDVPVATGLPAGQNA